MIIVKQIYKIRPDLAKKLVAISVVGAIKSTAIVGKFLPKKQGLFLVLYKKIGIHFLLKKLAKKNCSNAVKYE